MVLFGENLATLMQAGWEVRTPAAPQCLLASYRTGLR